MLLTQICFVTVDKTSFKSLLNRTQDNSSRSDTDNLFKGVTFVLETKKLTRMPNVVSMRKFDWSCRKNRSGRQKEHFL